MLQGHSLQLHKTIVIVGLMGCGKTSIGKRLAKVIDLPFVDLDNHIEQCMKMPVSTIFTEYGEAYFRALELEEAKKIMNGTPVVLATGGGAFINDEIRGIVKEKGLSVWIKADLDTLLERVSRRNTRPLLENGNKEEILKELMDKRYPIYEQADIKVDTSRYSKEIVVQRIIEAINGYIKT